MGAQVRGGSSPNTTLSTCQGQVKNTRTVIPRSCPAKGFEHRPATVQPQLQVNRGHGRLQGWPLPRFPCHMLKHRRDREGRWAKYSRQGLGQHPLTSPSPKNHQEGVHLAPTS